MCRGSETQLQVFLTLSILNLLLSSSPTTSRRNSRLVVNEDDLMWVKSDENCRVLVKQFHGKFILKPQVVGKSSLFSGM